jgi:transposase-like protein
MTDADDNVAGNIDMSACGSEGPEVPRPQRTGRPPPCPRCGSASWWNGWRLVFAVVVATVTGNPERLARWLVRAKCASCQRAFTCYPDDQYPHRQYQLDAVARVASAMAMGGEAAKQAAGRVGASLTSARRWTGWVSQLVEPSALLGVAQQLEQEVSVSEGFSTGEPPRSRYRSAARVLSALEQLSQVLVRRGLGMGCATGLGRVLSWQLRAHGDVVYLAAEPRCLSPRMALLAAGSGV